MATKQEIIDEIRRGMERVDTTFSPLSEDQLATRVHADAEREGWSAREILAHLAGRAQGHDRMFQMAEGTAQPRGDNFDVHHWNQQRVDERVDQERDELLQEFREIHERLIERVQAVPDEMLSKKVTTPRGEMEFGDVLKASGGTHSINHAAEVDEAITMTP